MKLKKGEHFVIETAAGQRVRISVDSEYGEDSIKLLSNDCFLKVIAEDSNFIVIQPQPKP